MIEKTTLHGIIQGKTIHLANDPGLAEGVEVEVVVQSVKPKQPWGEGLRRCAGALADQWTADDDRILEEIQQDRQQATHRALPE
jgi:hypothetical protein